MSPPSTTLVLVSTFSFPMACFSSYTSASTCRLNLSCYFTLSSAKPKSPNGNSQKNNPYIYRFTYYIPSSSSSEITMDYSPPYPYFGGASRSQSVIATTGSEPPPAFSALEVLEIDIEARRPTRWACCSPALHTISQLIHTIFYAIVRIIVAILGMAVSSAVWVLVWILIVEIYNTNRKPRIWFDGTSLELAITLSDASPIAMSLASLGMISGSPAYLGTACHGRSVGEKFTRRSWFALKVALAVNFGLAFIVVVLAWVVRKIEVQCIADGMCHAPE